MFYLKYRSQTIAEIDNLEIRETLGKALLENKFSHAYLLIGTRGSGKTSMARLIAKTVNCTGRKVGEEPCNKCESCKAVVGGRSLDVIEIDAASNTGVDDIRDLREKVKLAPVQGKFKIYIIDEVHMLSTSAFNALLKTLEEPPEHVIFVLATTDPQRLPETVVSRCLVYDFKTASKEEIIRSLSRVVEGEKIKVGEGVLEKIALMAKGSFRDAQKILEQLAMRGGKLSLEEIAEASSDSIRETALEILTAVDEKNAKSMVEIIEKFSKTGGRIETLIEEILNGLRDHLLTANGLAKEKFPLSFPDAEINNLVSDCLSALRDVRECPVPQLPLEAMLLEFIGRTVGSRKAIEPKEPGELKENRVFTDLSVEKVREKWPEILSNLKPYNHSLVAFLRACRPKDIVGESLIVEVFYKFHRDKLSEQQNREIFEKVVSGILGSNIKVKFQLSDKKGGED